MKKIFFFSFFILLFAVNLNAQEKYFIFFQDKGIFPQKELNKYSAVYNSAVKTLSPKAIQRRRKNMGDKIITYEDLPLNKNYLNKLLQLDIKIVHELKWFNAVSCYLSPDKIDVVKELPFVKELRKVKSLKVLRQQFSEAQELKEPVHKTAISEPIYYGHSLTQMSLSDVPQVQKMGFTGRGVIVGMLDTGFRWKNLPALRDRNVISEYDFVFNDSVTANQSADTLIQDNHGTEIFSICAGFDNGNLIGPAFDADFILAKTEDVRNETHAEEDNYAAALEWMENMGVDITTSSLGYTTFDPGESSYSYSDLNGNTTVVTKAAKLAFERGVVTISAAGNEGNDPWRHISAPADENNILAIGAVTSQNDTASFSGAGPTYDGRIKPDLVTQGVNTAVALAGGGYATGVNGTSASTPIAAGIAAQLLSAFPYLTNVQARSILLHAGDQYFTPDNKKGYGLLSALRAVTYPNLEVRNENYILHKIFESNDSIVVDSVRLFYSVNGSGFNNVLMNYDGELSFTYNFSNLLSGDSVKFYIETFRKNEIKTHEPGKGLYSFVKGGNNLIEIVERGNGVPADFELSQNFPNPFNDQTRIEFYTVRTSQVNIVIYNMLGQKVKNLFSGVVTGGRNILYWDGRNNSGEKVASGRYIYSLIYKDNFLSKKMILLK